MEDKFECCEELCSDAKIIDGIVSLRYHLGKVWADAEIFALLDEIQKRFEKRKIDEHNHRGITK